MAVEIKINPIDFELSTAIGIDLPMMGSVGGLFQQTYFSIDQALANARNLLLTNKGERIMQPTLGCDLSNILFENITEDLVTSIESNVRSSFNYWLPYIFINELLVTPNEDQNRINLKMTISLNNNATDTRSIQLEILNNSNI
jgi:phage baseplate assembly protein W